MVKIRSRATLNLIVAGLLPVVLLVGISSTTTSRQIRREALAKNAELAKEIRKQVERSLTQAVSYLEVLASNPTLINEGVDAGLRLKELKRLKNTEFAEISLLDSDGLMIESTSENAEVQEYSPWFKKARDDQRTVVSSPIRPSRRTHLVISVFLPVQQADGVQTAIIKANLDFQRISEIVQGIETGKGGSIMLLDRSGNILSSLNANRTLRKFDESVPMRHWRENPSGSYNTAQGQKFYYVAQPVQPPHQLNPQSGWMIVWLEDSREILAVVREMYVSHLLVAMIALLAACVLGFYGADRFAKPISKAAAAARKAAGGDLSTRMPDSNIEELSDLATSVNDMLSDLETTHAKLKTSLADRTESLLLAESTMAQLRASCEAIGEGLVVVDRNGEIIQMNSSFPELFDLPSKNYVGLQFAELLSWIKECMVDKSGFDSFYSYFESKPSEKGEEEWELSTPAEKSVRIYTAPVRNTISPEPFARLWLLRDLTEHRSLEEALRQSQKMEAVGQLAGGIAHDFNNLLTGISGNLDLGFDHLERQDFVAAKPHLNTARNASERAAGLVKKLLGFSRKSALQLSRSNFNALATECKDLLVHTLDPKMKIDLKLKEDLWDINVDPNQIQQVLMNLCVNARDAIDGEGTITVRTENKNIGLGEASDPESDSKEGDYVVLAVSDTGCGMTPAQKAKIFEPFFTTKEQGKGTGLGLSMCYGIVKQHDGWIDCISNAGVGTSFRVFLPRARHSEAKKEQEPSLSTAADLAIVPQEHTILLADDEPAVRMVAESLLKREGYRIYTASDGLEAVQLSRELGDKLDLVILDLTMPRLSGNEAFQMMAEEFPERPVLICSGYLLDLDKFKNDTGHTPAGFIQKPYKLNVLQSQVRHALASTDGLPA